MGVGVSDGESVGAEQALVLLLSALKSSYVYALHRGVSEEEVGGGCVLRVYEVEWSRRPSPHEPLPDVRVLMEVGLFHPSSPSRPPQYRLEGELCVHPFVEGGEAVGGRLRSVDGALLRAMKRKAELFRTERTATPYTAQQAAFLTSRLHYSLYTPPSPRSCFAQPPLLSASQLLAQLTLHLLPATHAGKGEPGAHSLTMSQAEAKRWSWRDDDGLGGEELTKGEEKRKAGACEPASSAPSTAAVSSDGGLGASAVSPAPAAARLADSALVVVAGNAAASSSASSPSHLSSSSPSSAAPPVAVVPSAAALEGRLVDLFRRADSDGSGRLSVGEVTALLSEGELGLSLSSSSLHAAVVGVMSSYDTNDDGQLVWAEFLPVAVDLLQTASAAKLAKAEMQRQREEGAASLERRLGGRTAADWAAEVAISVQALDPAHTQLIPPAAFQQLAHQLPCHLSGQPGPAQHWDHHSRLRLRLTASMCCRVCSWW